MTNLIDLLGRSLQTSHCASFSTAFGTQESTYRDLWRMSSGATRGLGNMAGERIAALLTPSPHMFAALIGCLRSGRDLVSLPLPHRGQSVATYSDDVMDIMQRCGAERLLVNFRDTALLAAVNPALGRKLLPVEGLDSGGNLASRSEPIPGRLIQFSSGTTGTAKGVVLDVHQIAANISSLIGSLRLSKADRVCLWVPLSHDMGLIGGLTALAGCGGYISLSPELFMGRPLTWFEACARARATLTSAPAFAYQIAARHLKRTTARFDLTSLRVCIVGAEPIPADTLRAFSLAAAPAGLSSRSLCPAYGLAEATLAVSIVDPEDLWTSLRSTGENGAVELVKCGRPLACVEVSASPDEGAPKPVRVRGTSVTAGYFGVASNRAPSDWFDTGDLGFLHGGQLVITGRADDLLLLAGRKVFAWEIERGFLDIDGVRQGCCVVVPDAQGRYAALFEADSSSVTPTRDMMMSVRRALVHHAGLGPSVIACVERGSLPKTSSGKIRRSTVASKLKEMLLSSVACQEF